MDIREPWRSLDRTLPDNGTSAGLRQQVEHLHDEVKRLTLQLRRKDARIAALIREQRVEPPAHKIDPKVDRFLPPWDADD
jgi:hypothetical protein